MKYKRIYALLKRLGHSPVKSAEIILDASRGDAWALEWIRTCYRISRL